MAAQFVVIGEALVDLVEHGDDEPRLVHPGGSPYNVAIGLARLGRATRFAGRFSRDPLGVVLRNHALRSQVDLSLCVDAVEPSTIALVTLEDGIADYRFGIAGTADFAWTAAELAGIPDGAVSVHFGSLASWLPPGDAEIAARVAALRAAGAFVSYDPNVRPRLQPDPVAARSQIESALHLAHVVKTSEEDLAHLYPGTPIDDIARQWLALGPDLVVVTRGGDGAVAHTATSAVSRPARSIEMVDTVGAGDSFTSGLLDALAERNLLHPDALAAASADDLAVALDHAGLVAAITCSRAGANPPRRAELDALA